MKRAAAIVKRAANNGLTEVEVGRFPNELTTDRGRAIIQQEPGWPDTLTGLPRKFISFGNITFVNVGTSCAFKWLTTRAAYRARLA